MEIPNKLIAIGVAIIVLILGVVLSVGTVSVEGLNEPFGKPWTV